MTLPLAMCMADRGRDSWGVSDGDIIYKSPTNILKTFRELDLEAPTYHTRGASVGGVSVENAHPFECTSTGRRVVGCHNGHIHNHTDLRAKYSRNSFLVDSQHIFQHLVEHADLSEIGGYGGMVTWWEMLDTKRDKRQRYITWFGNRACEVAKLVSGEIVFASTKSAIDISVQLTGAQIKHYYEPLKERVRYNLAPDELYEGPELAFGKSPYHEPYRHYASVVNSDITITDGVCATYDCMNEIDKKHLICGKCFARTQQDLGVTL